MEKKPKKPGVFYRRPDGEKFRFSANCCVLEFKEDGTLGFFKTFLNTIWILRIARRDPRKN